MKFTPIIVCGLVALGGCANAQTTGSSNGATDKNEIFLGEGAMARPAPSGFVDSFGELNDLSRRDPAGRRFDCFYFDLEQGKTATVDLSLMGYDSEVVFHRDADCQGGFMPFDGPDDAGLVEFTAPATSTYSFRAGAADANGHGFYILSFARR